MRESQQIGKHAQQLKSCGTNLCCQPAQCPAVLDTSGGAQQGQARRSQGQFCCIFIVLGTGYSPRRLECEPPMTRNKRTAADSAATDRQAKRSKRLPPSAPKEAKGPRQQRSPGSEPRLAQAAEDPARLTRRRARELGKAPVAAEEEPERLLRCGPSTRPPAEDKGKEPAMERRPSSGGNPADQAVRCMLQKAPVNAPDGSIARLRVIQADPQL